MGTERIRSLLNALFWVGATFFGAASPSLCAHTTDPCARGLTQLYPVNASILPQILTEKDLGLISSYEKQAAAIGPSPGNAHIPMLASQVPYYVAILNGVEQKHREEIWHRLSSFWQQTSQAPQPELNATAILEDAREHLQSHAVSVRWMSVFVARVLFYQTLEQMFWHSPYSTSSFALAQWIRRVNLAGKADSDDAFFVPVINLETVESFFPFWRLGLAPVGALDHLAAPYDGLQVGEEFKYERWRLLSLGFLFHDGGHANFFFHILKEITESIKMTETLSVYLRTFGFRTDDPKAMAVQMMQTYIDKGLGKFAKLRDTDLKKFLINLLWYTIHERPINGRTSDLVHASFWSKWIPPGFRGRFIDKLRLQRYQKEYTEFLLEPAGHNLRDMGWMIPEAWRTSTAENKITFDEEKVREAVGDFFKLMFAM